MHNAVLCQKTLKHQHFTFNGNRKIINSNESISVSAAVLTPHIKQMCREQTLVVAMCANLCYRGKKNRGRLGSSLNDTITLPDT